MLGSRVVLLGLLCIGSGAESSTLIGAASAQDSLPARLAAASELDDPVLRATQRSAIFFEARDFAAVLKEASAGLRHDPLALELLWRASAAELWLGDGERALSWLERLEAATDESELEPNQKESWLAAASNFEQQALQLLETEAAGTRALSRARLTTGVLALCALALFVWLASDGRKRRPA